MLALDLGFKLSKFFAARFGPIHVMNASKYFNPWYRFQSAGPGFAFSNSLSYCLWIFARLRFTFSLSLYFTLNWEAALHSVDSIWYDCFWSPDGYPTRRHPLVFFQVQMQWWLHFPKSLWWKGTPFAWLVGALGVVLGKCIKWKCHWPPNLCTFLCSVAPLEGASQDELPFSLLGYVGLL